MSEPVSFPANSPEVSNTPAIGNRLWRVRASASHVIYIHSFRGDEPSWVESWMCDLHWQKRVDWNAKLDRDFRACNRTHFNNGLGR
jgi:hypothetical protein